MCVGGGARCDRPTDLLAEHVAERDVRVDVTRVELDRDVEAFDRRGRVALLVLDVAEVVVRERVRRMAREHHLVPLGCRVEVAHLLVRARKVVARVDRDGLEEVRVEPRAVRRVELDRRVVLLRSNSIAPASSAPAVCVH